jgi:hypothetical protein
MTKSPFAAPIALMLTSALAPCALLAQTPAKTAAPDWVIPGAIIEMDFEHNRYFGASLDDLAAERSTYGYAQTKSGLLQRFGPNRLRLTDLGLLVESAQFNMALWSRDLTKDVWAKTNITAEAAPVGADGKAGGTRLTATADNATVLQTLHDVTRTMYGGRDEKGVVRNGGCHSLCYIKRVSGTGPVLVSQNHAATSWVDVSGLINADGYTQINLRYDGTPTTVMGIKLGTAGDVIDVDMMQFTVEASRNTVFSSTPFPVTDEVLWRDRDMVRVSPNSALYKALAGRKGTVYVKTFNLLGDNAAFYKFDSKEYGRSFGGRWGGAPCGAFVPQFDDGHFVIQTAIGSDGNPRFANYAWRTVGDKGVQNPQSILKTGATMRSVLTWGDGRASVVANNGPMGTGTCTDTEAKGTLCLGFTSWGGGDGLGYINGEPSHKSTYMCDGYIQRIAFIPHVVEGYGAHLTVGPEANPAAKPPKLWPLLSWTNMWTKRMFEVSTKVKLESRVSGARICYTLDGSEPDPTKTLYTGPIELKETTTVKARAYKPGHTESDLFDVSFTRTGSAAMQPK